MDPELIRCLRKRFLDAGGSCFRQPDVKKDFLKHDGTFTGSPKPKEARLDP